MSSLPSIHCNGSADITRTSRTNLEKKIALNTNNQSSNKNEEKKMKEHDENKEANKTGRDVEINEKCEKSEIKNDSKNDERKKKKNKDSETGSWIDDSTLPNSEVYLKDLNNHIHCLRFKTFHAVITPVKVDGSKRLFEGQKMTQTHTREKYVTKFFADHSRMFLYVRQDERQKTKKMNSKSDPTVTPESRSDGKKKDKPKISDKSTTTFSSTIYVRCLDMKLVLKLPKFLKFEAIRFLQDKLSSSDYQFNRVITHSVYKKDLVKIQFEIKEVDLVKISPTSTRAAGTDNFDIVYHKIYTDISNRSVYCPIPRTTYFHEDPLRNARRRTLVRTQQMREPYMASSRLQRTNKRRKGREEFINFCEKKGGTSIVAKIAGITVRTRCGVTHLRMYDDDEAYSQWVKDIQSSLPPIRKRQDHEWCGTCEQLMHKNREDSPSLSGRNSQNGYKVDDWNLVLKDEDREK